MSDNDLISRQDAIEAIRKSTEKYNYFMEIENYGHLAGTYHGEYMDL